jgi:predicted metalloprotease with PDZ domain
VRGYTVADVQQAVAEVTKDSAFARDFFRRYVIGSELPDYPALLARAGFAVRQALPTAAWMGDTRLSAQDGAVLLAGPTTIGSPMYEAGLSAGDRIFTLDGANIASLADVRAALGAKKPGDRMRITWMARDGERSAEMVLKADPRVEVVAFEDAGQSISPAQMAFRNSWLASRQR